MYDLLALAYQADLTRVATYVTVAEGTSRSYPFLEVAGGFHRFRTTTTKWIASRTW